MGSGSKRFFLLFHDTIKKKTDGVEPPIVSSAVVSFLRTARPRVVSLSEPHDEEHPLGFEWSRRVTSHKLTHSCCEVRRKPQT